MTSREIVRRTLEFDNPERVARSFHDSDLIWADYDVKGHYTDWREVGNGRWEHSDLWGNLWARVDETSKGEAVAGVFEDIAALDRYAWPDFSKPESYAGARKIRADHPDKWIMGGLPGFPFSIARTMQRLDTYLVNLIAEPEFITRLHDHIEHALTDIIRNFAKAGVDGVMFGEDWGTQLGLFISPEMFRSEFLPRFERLCAVAHQGGIKVFMHSCGQIEAIVPPLIDAGVDVFQFDQPDLHGLNVLASHQKRAKITYWSPVDVQKALQTRDEKLIRAKAREMLDTLWKGRGGFIAGYYGDNASIGLDPAVQEWACDEFERYGARK